MAKGITWVIIVALDSVVFISAAQIFDPGAICAARRNGFRVDTLGARAYHESSRRPVNASAKIIAVTGRIDCRARIL